MKIWISDILVVIMVLYSKRFIWRLDNLPGVPAGTGSVILFFDKQTFYWWTVIIANYKMWLEPEQWFNEACKICACVCVRWIEHERNMGIGLWIGGFADCRWSFRGILCHDSEPLLKICAQDFFTWRDVANTAASAGSTWSILAVGTALAFADRCTARGAVHRFWFRLFVTDCEMLAWNIYGRLARCRGFVGTRRRLTRLGKILRGYDRAGSE